MMRMEDASEIVGDDVEDRQRGRGSRRADDRVDLVLADDLLGVLHRGRGVRRLVQNDEFDGLAADRFRAQAHGVPLGNAERCRGPGRRHDDTHLDLRLAKSGGCEHGAKQCAADECVLHVFSGLSFDQAVQFVACARRQ